MAAPTSPLRRSFVHRELVAADARLESENGALAAMDYGDPAGEAAAAGHLALADLSPLARTGFKGPGTAAWIASQGVALPRKSNEALRQSGGALVARLAPEEVLVLGSLTGGDDLPARLDRAWAADPSSQETPRGFPVPRADSHAWFMLMGSASPTMFAKICGIDLRPAKFAFGRIAQTSIARLNGILIRDDLDGRPAYHLLTDSAAAGYLWVCLQDAMAEFDGRFVGLAALRTFAHRTEQ